MYKIDPDTILWTKHRLLEVDDFQNPPQKIVKDGTEKDVAYTTTKIDPRVMPTPCSKTEFVLNYEIFALFIRSKSYMVKDLGDSKRKRLLRHEQGHFDICEEHCRILKEKLECEFKGKKFLLEGNSAKEQKSNADKKGKVIIDYAIAESKEAQKTHDLYDEETHHGMNQEKQEEYNKRFDKLRE